MHTHIHTHILTYINRLTYTAIHPHKHKIIHTYIHTYIHTCRHQWRGQPENKLGSAVAWQARARLDVEKEQHGVTELSRGRLRSEATQRWTRTRKANTTKCRHTEDRRSIRNPERSGEGHTRTYMSTHTHTSVHALRTHINATIYLRSW